MIVGIIDRGGVVTLDVFDDVAGERRFVVRVNQQNFQLEIRSVISLAFILESNAKDSSSSGSSETQIQLKPIVLPFTALNGLKLAVFQHGNGHLNDLFVSRRKPTTTRLFHDDDFVRIDKEEIGPLHVFTSIDLRTHDPNLQKGCVSGRLRPDASLAGVHHHAKHSTLAFAGRQLLWTIFVENRISFSPKNQAHSRNCRPIHFRGMKRLHENLFVIANDDLAASRVIHRHVR